MSHEASEHFTRIYLDMIERHYPKLKDVVTHALKDSDVEKFYEAVLQEKEWES